MAYKIFLQENPNEPLWFAYVNPINMSDAFTIPNDFLEWAVRTIIGDHWIAANPVAPPSFVVSRFASNFMDLCHSRDLTKLVIGAFIHSFAFTWEEVNLQLDNYALSNEDLWWGGFLNKDFFRFDSTPRLVFISFIRGLQFSSPHPFLAWVQ